MFVTDSKQLYSLITRQLTNIEINVKILSVNICSSLFLPSGFVVFSQVSQNNATLQKRCMTNRKKLAKFSDALNGKDYEVGL
jgi:hypothetical protein